MRMPPITLRTCCHSTFLGFLVLTCSFILLSLCNASPLYMHLLSTSSTSPLLQFCTVYMCFPSSLHCSCQVNFCPFFLSLPLFPPRPIIALRNHRVVSLPLFFPSPLFLCFQTSMAFRNEWLGTRILPMNPSNRAPVIGSVS